jgi:hypothetical protein
MTTKTRRADAPGRHPQGITGTTEQARRAQLFPQSTPSPTGCNHLDRLAPVRRARAIGLGRWLIRSDSDAVTLGFIERELGADGYGWRRCGKPTRTELQRGLDDLERAGGVTIAPYGVGVDLEIDILPALLGLVAAPHGDLPL